jgi:methionine-rich copper-binding protein CopC
MKKNIIKLTLSIIFIINANAYAHISVIDSYPLNGNIHNELTTDGKIVFSQNIEINTAKVEIKRIGDFNSGYESINNNNSSYQKLNISNLNNNTLLFELPDLESGFYEIKYYTKVQGDHENEGKIYFKVKNKDKNFLIVAIIAGIIILSLIILLFRKRIYRNIGRNEK